jgi:alcohol dehydrogenase class IV
MGNRETFISFAAYFRSPTTPAPRRVSTPITAGTMSQTTQFSVCRKKERISMMAWKPCWESTM